MTTIVLYSDTHIEFDEHAHWSPEIPSDADVIVLSGDIGAGDRTIDFVKKLAKQHPDKHIIFLAGNHEYYGQNLPAQLKRYKTAFRSDPHVHFLENSEVEIYGVRFLGCTLWTDFTALEPDIQAAKARYTASGINDFRLIMTDDGLITPEAMAHINAESVRWLEKELATEFLGKTVVITHFPPCKNLRHGQIPVDDLTPYFLNDLEWLIEKYRPAAWLYGHNHWSDDREMHGCRVVSNQLGYPFENRREIGFRECLLIEV